MRESLEQLVDTLPKCEGMELDPTPQRSEAFSTNIPSEPGYVWPDIEFDSADSDPSPILLVRAPGAMGKSVAARAVAAKLQCPLVDLSRTRVGSDGLIGMLTRSLGWTLAPRFIAQLQAGRASLVLDSTDEAQLAAGQENFLAFLQDLCLLLAQAVPGSQVFIFGRPDAIETTYLGLAEGGLLSRVAEIMPLTYLQACTLIDSVLDNRFEGTNESTRVHRTHAEPFGRLRDQVFKSVAKALGGGDEPDFWNRDEAFLGYPPVLLALAERLAVDNPQAESASPKVAALSARKRQGTLLREIVEDILDRESGKVRQGVREKVGLSQEDVRLAVLYTREEQCVRVARAVLGRDFEVPGPASLSPSERSKYEELVSAFVLDHPFIRGKLFANSVFNDYVRAFLATSPIQDAVGMSKNEVVSGFPRSGVFFAHFSFELAPSRVGESALIAEDLVGELIKSYSDGFPDSHSIYSHRGSNATLMLYDISTEGQRSVDSALLFEVTDLSGVLSLTGPMARCVILTENGVSLSGDGGIVALGPDAIIIAQQLEISGTTVTASRGRNDSEGGHVLLSAAECEHDPKVQIFCYPADALAVNWPGQWHQWKKYQIGTSGLTTQGSQIAGTLASQVLVGIRRILLSFGPSRKSDPVIFGDKLDQLVIGGSGVFQAVADSMMGLGLIVKQGSVYRLDLNRAAEFDVVWAKLHGAEMAGMLAPLSSAVVEQPAFIKFLDD